MADRHDRLVLGTVQLGMPYGIANESGQPDFEKAREIIATAWETGIYQFDTAQGYGQSESVLAKALTDLQILSEVRVFTKIDPAIDHTDWLAIRQAICKSSTLFGPALYCLMLHNEEYLKHWPEGLGEVLRECRDQGLYTRVGVSVYDPPAARWALETEGIDLIQLPANVLDRRHERAGVMALAHSLRKTIVIRSIFLQGALLLPEDKLPQRIHHARPYMEPIHEVAHCQGINPRDLCIGFVREHWPDSLVVFGAERTEQVSENVSSWSNPLPQGTLEELDTYTKFIPLEVLRPDLWGDVQVLVTGTHIRLRPMQPSDAWGDYANWMNDYEVIRFLESRFCSYTSDDLEQYILRQRVDPNVEFLAIEEISSGRHIGNIKIGPRHAVHETAELGFIIGAKDCWGKGFASEAVALALKLAFETLAIRKVVAGCYGANIASERVFIKNGFVREGLFNQHVMADKVTDDVIVFGLMRETWLENRSLVSLDTRTAQYKELL